MSDDKDPQRISDSADNCEVLRARLSKYEDAEGRPVVVGDCAPLLADLSDELRAVDLISTPFLADLYQRSIDALESQAREIERLTREAKNDAIAYKAAIERQNEIRAELAALKAQPSGVVPQGWRIDREGDRIVVQGPYGGYAAERRGLSGIAESVLYCLADAMLILNSSPVSAGDDEARHDAVKALHDVMQVVPCASLYLLAIRLKFTKPAPPYQRLAMVSRCGRTLSVSTSCLVGCRQT